MSDLIYRQDAIEILATMQGLCGTREALVQNSKIWQQIKDIPSAEPERKKGRWLNEYDGRPAPWYEGYKGWYPCSTVVCSECGDWLVASDEYSVRGNYCPNCGADMRCQYYKCSQCPESGDKCITNYRLGMPLKCEAELQNDR